MPANSNNGGGPWGGPKGGGKPPGGGDQGPELDDVLRKGFDNLRVVLGGKDGDGGEGPNPGKMFFWGLIGLVLFWGYQSFYRVSTGEESIELTFGEYTQTGTEGLNFAPWPVTTYEVRSVTLENKIESGKGDGTGPGDQGLMLTGDENIVDIDFSVVWNISRLDQFLFNLAEPDSTIQAVSESAMREVVARKNLATILTVDRAAIAQEVGELIQATLDSYESGVNIVRVNFERADPPAEVIDAFRDVQAAEQDRVTLQNRADAYANQKLAEARGEVAKIQQDAEAYRAQVVNEAAGEAARFNSVYEEYRKAPEVTRKRLYLETMERVLGDVEKVIIDDKAGGAGQGVVPYLPLNELRKGGSN